MTGRIIGISGPTVTVEFEGLTLYERVYVGSAMLTGEVVRLEKDRAIVQVYESTRGLGAGEPVIRTGTPMTARLGPGLLGGMFDGLQRPLGRLREELGPFITRGKEIYAIDHIKEWEFFPLKKPGDSIAQGEAMGYVDENAFRHYISFNESLSGTIAEILSGRINLTQPVAALTDGRGVLACHEWPVRTTKPYRRKIPSIEPIITGYRIVDFLYPLARGGTAMIPGGFGTGKTVLQQGIAKFADADIVIYTGCGERGNEMAELIEDFLNLRDRRAARPLMDRSMLVVNTSNMPVAAREASIYTAVTMAEYYRDMGYNVLLLADSLSRWAEALREISTSLGEMPGEEGYPTYLSSRLSAFFERAGVVETLGGRIGSLSMILSVSPPGADFTEPVTQGCLRVAGALLMLDTDLAHRRHFPAINWFQSYSLYEGALSGHFTERYSARWGELKARCRKLLQSERALRDIVEVVGFEGLQDEDRLMLRVVEAVRSEFLSQSAYTDDAFCPPEKTLSMIERLIVFYENASERLKKGEELDALLAEAGI